MLCLFEIIKIKQCPSNHYYTVFLPCRMSNMRMEELNRRHSTLGSQSSPLKSAPGSPQVAGGENCLVVAVQQRRASIISISPDNLLDVVPHTATASSSHSRSASVRSTHSVKHKQVRGETTVNTVILVFPPSLRPRRSSWITNIWLGGGKVMPPLTTAGTAALDTETPGNHWLASYLLTVELCSMAGYLLAR